MKLKLYFLLSFLLITTSTIYSQQDRKIYEVTIFKWTKENNKDVMKVVKIDSLGNIYLSKQKSGKVDLKNFTKKINQFVKNEKLEKVPGSDEPPRMSLIPKEGKQTIEISITFLDDYHKDINLANYTYFSSNKTGLEISNDDYLIYNYLTEKDAGKIKSLLK